VNAQFAFEPEHVPAGTATDRWRVRRFAVRVRAAADAAVFVTLALKSGVSRDLSNLAEKTGIRGPARRLFSPGPPKRASGERGRVDWTVRPEKPCSVNRRRLRQLTTRHTEGGSPGHACGCVAGGMRRSNTCKKPSSPAQCRRPANTLQAVSGNALLSRTGSCRRAAPGGNAKSRVCNRIANGRVSIGVAGAMPRRPRPAPMPPWPAYHGGPLICSPIIPTCKCQTRRFIINSGRHDPDCSRHWIGCTIRPGTSCIPKPNRRLTVAAGSFPVELILLRGTRDAESLGSH